MATHSKIIAGLKMEIRLLKETSRDRLDMMQKQVDVLEKRLDRLDTPAKGQKPKSEDYKKRLKTPVPDRPPVMVAAGVGKDPR